MHATPIQQQFNLYSINPLTYTVTSIPHEKTKPDQVAIQANPKFRGIAVQTSPQPVGKQLNCMLGYVDSYKDPWT